MSELLKSFISIFSEKKAAPSHAEIQEATKFIKLCLAQLSLMESFVGDMLNNQLLQEGHFKIMREPFDLLETFDFIVSIFEIKALAFGVKLSYSFCQDLEDPTAQK